MVNVICLDLYTDDREESQLAIKMLESRQLSPVVHYSNKGDILKRVGPKGIFSEGPSTICFSNSLNEQFVPSLFYREPTFQWSHTYLSFSGIKSFLRGYLEKESGVKVKDCRNDVKTFYRHGNFRKIVTCFDYDGKNIFEGAIDKAPHKFESYLEKHDFKDWNWVGSWEIGNFGLIPKLQGEQGMVILREKKALLLSEDIDVLNNGGLVIENDSRSTYHVTFSAFYNCEGKIFRFHASMVD